MTVPRKSSVRWCRGSTALPWAPLHHRGAHGGGRLSRKACIPAAASSLVNNSADRFAAHGIASDGSMFGIRCRTSFAAANANGPPSRRSSTIASISASMSAGSTALLIRPSRAASTPSKRRPRRNASLASPRRIFGRQITEMIAGATPSRTSVKPNFAVVVRNRDVECGGQAGSARDRVPGDSPDPGFRRVLNPVEQRQRIDLAGVTVCAGTFRQIGAGAEHRTRVGHHNHPHASSASATFIARNQLLGERRAQTFFLSGSLRVMVNTPRSSRSVSTSAIAVRPVLVLETWLASGALVGTGSARAVPGGYGKGSTRAAHRWYVRRRNDGRDMEFDMPPADDPRRLAVRAWIADNPTPSDRELAESRICRSALAATLGGRRRSHASTDHRRGAGRRQISMPKNAIGIGWAAPVIWMAGPRSRRRGTCPASSATKNVGASCSANPIPVRISRVCPPEPYATATST